MRSLFFDNFTLYALRANRPLLKWSRSPITD